MIKGINHTIIETNETGSEYYERAMLIIKPEYASVQRSILEAEAKRLLKEFDAPSAIRSGTGKLKMLLSLIAAAISGAAISGLIFMIIR